MGGEATSGWGVLSAQRNPDRLYDAVDILHDVVVPESQNAKAMFGEPSIAGGVASALGVLAAIDLDDKALLSTDKIDDVRSNRFLANEFEPAQRP